MSTTSRFSLRRLLLALLDNQHQLDERERAEAEAKWSAGGPKGSDLRDRLRAFLRTLDGVLTAEEVRFKEAAEANLNAMREADI
jgi:hypothetical protein